MGKQRITLTLMLVAVTLTGCATETTSAPTTTPTPTTSTTQSPSSTPEPIDLADPSSWIISGEGIGPITLGQTLDDAALALSSFTQQDLGCDNPGVRLYAAPGAPTVALFVAADSATVSGIRISDYDGVLPASASPRTAEGLGLGSTVAEVQAQYPDAVGEAAAGSPNYTHVVDDDIWISFSTLFSDGTQILNVDVAKGGHMFYELCGV